MRPVLASIIICHWIVVFGLLAAVSALDPDVGPLAAFEMIGAKVSLPVGGHFNPLLTASAASAVTIIALLFAWALLCVAFGGKRPLEDGVVTLAFASAAGLLCVALAGGFLLPVNGVFVPVAIHLVALLVSYVAIALPVPTTNAAPRRRHVEQRAQAAATERPSGLMNNRLEDLG
jgi:hypothetical protein